MRGLTIRQPWAAAIAYADKRVENRVWPTTYLGTVLVHSSRTVDRAAQRHEPIAAVVRGLQLDFGAVVAVARITGCHPDDGQCTPWSAKGQHHIVLDQVSPLYEPVPARGALGLWIPSAQLVEQVRLQLDPAAAALLDEEAGPC